MGGQEGLQARTVLALPGSALTHLRHKLKARLCCCITSALELGGHFGAREAKSCQVRVCAVQQRLDENLLAGIKLPAAVSGRVHANS